MSPTLAKGDIIVCDLWIDTQNLQVGDVIVFEHPYRKNIHAVKRIENINNASGVMVLGDNLDGSVDSRAFGEIRNERIIARVFVNFRKARARSLSRSTEQAN